MYEIIVLNRANPVDMVVEVSRHVHGVKKEVRLAHRLRSRSRFLRRSACAALSCLVLTLVRSKKAGGCFALVGVGLSTPLIAILAGVAYFVRE